MSAFLEIFCDYCNGSRQRRDPGDEVEHGYARGPVTTPGPGWFPDGWLAVRNPSGSEQSKIHACPTCVDARGGDYVTATMPTEAPRATPTDKGWPSITSPFGAQERTEMGADVGRANGGGVDSRG